MDFGWRVKHKEYGEGVIMRVNGIHDIGVLFDGREEIITVDESELENASKKSLGAAQIIFVRSGVLVWAKLYADGKFVKTVKVPDGYDLFDELFKGVFVDENC